MLTNELWEHVVPLLPNVSPSPKEVDRGSTFESSLKPSFESYAGTPRGVTCPTTLNIIKDLRKKNSDIEILNLVVVRKPLPQEGGVPSDSASSIRSSPRA